MGAPGDNRHRKGWFWEYSRTACDELLNAPELHEELVGLYAWCPNATEEICERSFPGYVLIERLDDGTGLGMVFLAITDPEVHPLNSRRTVCIKIPSLNRNKLQRGLANDAINNEIQILRALESCPMVHGRRPRFVGCGSIDLNLGKPLPYVVTEYIPFLTSLQRYSRNADVKTWINISLAVNELHSVGIVHGDIYERNIFVDRSGQPVLLDFGAARRIRRLTLRVEQPPSSFPPDCLMLDEIAIPNQRLSCAFDVACLAQTFQRLLSKVSSEYEESSTSLELRKLLGICTRTEPEYRPQTAGDLADLFEKVVDNQPAIVKPARLALFNSLYRRYPTVVWPALSVSFLLVVLSIFLSMQWRGELKQREKEQKYNQQLIVSAVAKEKALASMFHAMQEMLNSTIALDEAQIPTQTNGKVSRQGIAVELANIVRDTSVSRVARLSALQLLLDTVRGHLEVDGVDFAQQCVKVARDAIGDPSGFPNCKGFEFQCLTAQLMVFESAMEMRSLSPNMNRSQALQLASAAIDQYLAIRPDENWTDEQRLLFIKTGIDVLGYAIYSFRASEWKDIHQEELVFRVFKHATAPFDSGAEDILPIRFSLARINYSYALLIHKSYVPHIIKQSTEKQFALVQEHIFVAKSILQQILDGELSSTGSIEREMKELDAALSSLAGLSFIQTSDYVKARTELERAFAYRKIQVIERPGSLRAIRQVIGTAWNLSDTYFSEARVSANQEELYMQSIPSRQFAVDECNRLYLASPDEEVKTAYVVNQVRLSFSQILCGREGEAIEGLREAADLIALTDPGTQHGLGEDLFICLAFLSRAYPNEARYADLLQKQSTILAQRFHDIRAGTNSFQFVGGEAQLNEMLSLLKSPQFASLSSEPTWSAVVEACENAR